MAIPVNKILLKDNITELAQGNLLYQFKNKEDINKLVKVFTEEVQELENEIIKLLTERTLEASEGVQLDNIGEVLNFPRTTENDDLYRNFLKIRNTRQTGVGDTESVIQLLQLFTGDTSLSLVKGYGYFVDLTFSSYCNPLSANYSEIKSFFPVVTELRAVITSGKPFGFDGDDDALGFGSIHDIEAGGGLVSKLRTV